MTRQRLDLKRVHLKGGLLDRLILVPFVLLAVQICEGAANSDSAVTNTGLTATRVLQLLTQSEGLRSAQCTQDALLGKQAPPLAVDRWLHAPGFSEAWPSGQLTVLYFWDINCGACMGAKGRIDEMAANLTADGGTFISIHSNVKHADVLRQILKERGIDHCVAVDSLSKAPDIWRGRTFEAYGVCGVPDFITIGADGRVLSFRQPERKDWQRLIHQEPAKIEADQPRKVRSLVVAPKRWDADALAPGVHVTQSILLYRPDSPELEIGAPASSDPNVVVTYTKHSDAGQAVFALHCRATAPHWGQTLAGNIHVKVECQARRDTVEVPFRLSSKPLLSHGAPVYFGICQKDQVVSRRIVLRSSVSREQLKLQAMRSPRDITTLLPQSLDDGPGDVPIEVHFCGSEPGIHRGVVGLDVLHGKSGCRQSVDLQYVAIVRN